jgi:hypothetical protein
MANDSPAAILFDQYGNPIGDSLDQDGYYRLKVESIVDKVIPTFSVNNSTTTPLAAFGVFQGTSEDITGFVSTDVTVLSDVTSAVDGLLFEWSQDNINWNYSDGTSFTITGGVGQNYSLSPRAKYFRLSYTNGVSNQTNFALSVSHYPIDRSPVLSNLSTDVLAQRSTEVVRSILAAQKQGGAAQTNNYTNLQATTVGFLKVSVDTVVTPPVIIPTVVQAQPTAPSLGTTFFDTFDNDTAINNAIIALVIQGAGSSGVTYTFSDSQGNLYVKGASFASPGVGQIDLWYTNAIGGPLTVAATNFSTPTTVALQIYEVNGLLVGATILDKAIVGLGNSTNLSAGPILTNHDTEFCISAFVTNGTPTITPDVGWNVNLSAPGFFAQSQTQAVAGTITGLATASVAESYLGILVTFLPALVSRPLVQDASGRLQTVIPYVLPTVSALNSTTIPLGSNDTFVGVGEDVSTFNTIDVTVLSDVVSAINGLLFEWSQDNITYNYPESFTIQANVGQYYSITPRAKYFRITYTNGAIAQTNFDLSVVYYPLTRGSWTQNLDTDVPSQKATEVVRSVLAAQKQGGAAQSNDYTNLQATTGGFLKVSLDTVVSPPIITPTVVQRNNTPPTTGNLFSISFGDDTTINNAVIVLVMQGQGTSSAAYTLTDTQGNLYVEGASVINDGYGQIDLWYTTSIGGSDPDIIANFVNPATVSLQIYEVSGLLIGSPILDQFIFGVGSGTSLTTQSILTNHDGEFCIAAFAGAGTSIILAGDDWTQDLSAIGFGAEHQIQNAAGLITGTATAASSVTYVSLLATFFPALVSRPIVQDPTGRLIVISQITDGYYGPVSVAPPLTAAMATDSALVVAISPNTPITTTAARPSTNDTFSVAASTTNTILLPSNTLRLGATIYNDASALLYVKLGVSASLSDFTVKLFPLSYYEVPFGYTGEIDGIWSNTGGFARIGELTL